MNKPDAEKVRDMLRLIPNGVSVSLEDLLEIFSQEDDTNRTG